MNSGGSRVGQDDQLENTNTSRASADDRSKEEEEDEDQFYDCDEEQQTEAVKPDRKGFFFSFSWFFIIFYLVVN